MNGRRHQTAHGFLTQRSLTAATRMRRFDHRHRTASRRGCGCLLFCWILCRLAGAFHPRINMAHLRRFRACSGTRKFKRRFTRIRRDERGSHAGAATGLHQSHCRFRLYLRYPFLSASICVSTFSPPAATRTRSAKEHQIEKRRRSASVGCAGKRRLVRTAPCVASFTEAHTAACRPRPR